MSIAVFVDGQEGTTGLKLNDYLCKFPDIELLKIDPAKRKDPAARSLLLNEADIAFLCLPDDAARQSVSLVTNPKTKIINSSTAFRTDPSWVYGLPELKGQRDRIRSAARVSVPGCHATGFILSIRPLVEAGLLPPDYPIACHSVSGYSGAGKSKIEMYENEDLAAEKKLNVPRHYALLHNHKHLPEMRVFSGLAHEPEFTPIIARYAQGSAVVVPLAARYLNQTASAQQVHETLAAYYEGEPFVRVMPFESDAALDDGYFKITELNNTNRLELFVYGDNSHIKIVSRFDNLGKGAAGAAVQNMNLMLGYDEQRGLV
ncbi:N-acetyl-gamma-glutamyl-phosphate reductase [Paenibacillus thalictri]|uniref:N-acetyl-gamma-glutamyl-phosphate reductase n=1 Tax=Paenibacillus thalictri TaxID=2527873 RepID=A0A4V2J3B2_9BACL|nr:N-acetyl-gamma-glutamyl-phosphate reductase [Paenibacillus thalictri]TBL70882.1 N-acetyl-gamma-glutamyl-phosphate reductase [Paenibacillus thalictri]